MGGAMIEFIGWFGSLLLAFCGLPQAIVAIRKGNAEGIDTLFLLSWFLGEVFTLTYIFYSTFRWPLIFNYTANIVFILIIFYFKYYPRKKHI